MLKTIWKQCRSRLAPLAVTAGVALALTAAEARAQGTLRIAMTATDVPITTGAPDNGFEGIRFVGYPAFEGLVLWDLSRSDQLAEIRPGLAERWEQDPNDPAKWIFHLRRGVNFHDGSTFNADAAIWNLDRYHKADAPHFEPAGAAQVQARIPFITSYRKIDDYTVEITTPRPLSYFPNLLPYMLFSSPAQYARAGSWAEFAKAPSGTGPFRIVELGSTEAAIGTPAHPYTAGLLGSTVLGSSRGERLEAIAGMPPDLRNLPQGCSFAPRCRFAIDACREAVPEFVETNSGHFTRCLRIARGEDLGLQGVRDDIITIA